MILHKKNYNFFRFKFLFLFLFILISTTIFNSSISWGIPSNLFSVDFRNYPSGFSAGVESKLTQYLWGEQAHQEKADSILYGIIQEHLQVASHGLIGGVISLYPISFIRLRTSKSIVSRYYETSTLPCKSIYCYGNIQRDNYSISIALGYENYIFVPELEMSHQKPQSNLKNYGSEDEILVGRAGGDEIKTVSHFIGYKNNLKSIVGLYVKSSETRFFKNNALFRYFVYQQPLSLDAEILDIKNSNINVKTGIGFFTSTWVPNPQFSIFIGLSGGIGDDPSLF